jgi:5-methylcytosine-specific restriction endonuclease McrA
MSNAPSRLCLDGCTRKAINDSKYCAEHQTTNKATHHKLLYDRYRANDECRKLYKKRRWQQTRLIIFKREPLCVVCGHRASTVADHHPLEAREIVQRYGVNEFYNPQRSRGVCKQCHDSKTATTRGFAKSKSNEANVASKE